MSLAFYKILHFACLAALLFSFAGLFWQLFQGGGAAPRAAAKKLRRAFLAVHGLSMLLLFVSGFGLIAKLKMPFPWPAWLYVKLSVWTALAAAPVFLRPGIPWLSWIRPRLWRESAALAAVCLLALTALFAAFYKP